AAAHFVREFGRTLQQPAVEIEHVTGIRLTAGRASQHQRQLPVRRGLLGQVVVHTQRRLLLVVHEVLRHRATRIRRDILHGGRFRGGRHDDDRVLHRVVLLEPLDDGRDGRVLLPDRHVHTDDALALLIDDRVDGDGGFARATIADDQLALAAADRDHRVDRLDAGLQRLLHRLALDDAGRDDLDFAGLGRVNRTEPIHRSPQRVHDAAHQRRADGHFEHAGRAADLVTLAQLEVVAENHGADVVFLEVQGEPGDLLAGPRDREFEHLARHGGREPVDPGDAVLDLEDGADFADVDVRQVSGLDFLEEKVLQLAGTQDGVGGHWGTG